VRSERTQNTPTPMIEVSAVASSVRWSFSDEIGEIWNFCLRISSRG
jgi:hypothetical protein